MNLPRCVGVPRHTCPVTPDRMILAGDGFPRLACPFHAIEGAHDLPAQVVEPQGLKPEVLKQWRGREKERQRTVRRKIEELEEWLRGSERRVAGVEAALASQAPLPWDEPGGVEGVATP